MGVLISVGANVWTVVFAGNPKDIRSRPANLLSERGYKERAAEEGGKA